MRLRRPGSARRAAADTARARHEVAPRLSDGTAAKVTADTITAAAVKAKAEVLVAEIRQNLSRINELIVEDEDET